MTSRIHHFKSFSMVKGDIKVNIRMERLSMQYNRAQFYLDSQVMTDMVPLMPDNTEIFVNLTKQRSAAMAGTGQVCAAAPPYGRFLYEGKVMVDPATNSPWARKGAKKVVTDRDLTYSNPRAVPHWFDEAKRLYLKQWVKGVKKYAGGK